MYRMKRLVAMGLLCGVMMSGAGVAGAAAEAPGRVDVNAASAEELERLPGVGPSLARAIVEHRTQTPFRRPEDVRDVKGIGDRLYEKLKDQITVGDAPASSRGRGE
jgi:competence ComEA-like helix-hairpin-helix protein